MLFWQFYNIIIYAKIIGKLDQETWLGWTHFNDFFLAKIWPILDHIRAIPCQRSEKKGQLWKVDFFNEMWKIMGQIDDFDRFLNNSCNLGVFLAKNQKFPKMTVLKKWKLIFFLKIEQLISNSIYIILIVWILWFC